ncbi:hypothetical protein BH23BAC1_BH23BAC1_02650 [soil metagenome]
MFDLKPLNIGKLLSNLKDYASVKFKLVKIDTSVAASKGIAWGALGFVLFLLSIFTLIFFSITIGLILNALLNSSFWGFVIVTLLYIILLVVLISMREKIVNKISKTIQNSII